MKVYVGAYYGLSLVSWGIQTATWGPISHTALIKENGNVIESWHKGGVLLNNTPWELHTRKTKIGIFELTYDGTEVWEKALAEVGKKYDFKALMGFIPALRYFHKNDPKRWFCSELVSYACRLKGQRGTALFNSTLPHHKVDPTRLCSSPNLEFLGYVFDMRGLNRLINPID